MSTATLQPSQQQPPPRAASAQGHRQSYLRSSNPNNARSASHPHPSRQYEKDLVLKHADVSKSKDVLSPEEISHSPEDKQVGRSSKQLKVTDFDLMRTLGTGMLDPFSAAPPVILLTTFLSSQVRLPECGCVVLRTHSRPTETRCLRSRC